MRTQILRFIVWLLRIETHDVIWVDYSDMYYPRWGWDRDPPRVIIGPPMRLSDIAQDRRCDVTKMELITNVTTKSKDTPQSH